jgi:N6-L-threonylcarbamoyladenine synthase
VKDWGKYKLLGSTRDDAPGEAFDKIAKLLGLGYPGGPAIEKFSANGNRNFIKFPRAMKEKDNFEFSFSGLKTAVAIYLKDKSPEFISDNLSDIAASFQEAVCEILAIKTLNAASAYDVPQISVTGGVARNGRLREIFEQRKPSDLEVFFPSPELCSDNGAMIAACGSFHLSKGEISDLSLNAVPYLEL